VRRRAGPAAFAAPPSRHRARELTRARSAAGAGRGGGLEGRAGARRRAARPGRPQAPVQARARGWRPARAWPAAVPPRWRLACPAGGWPAARALTAAPRRQVAEEGGQGQGEEGARVGRAPGAPARRAGRQAGQARPLHGATPARCFQKGAGRDGGGRGRPGGRRTWCRARAPSWRGARTNARRSLCARGSRAGGTRSSMPDRAPPASRAGSCNRCNMAGRARLHHCPRGCPILQGPLPGRSQTTSLFPAIAASWPAVAVSAACSA